MQPYQESYRPKNRHLILIIIALLFCIAVNAQSPSGTILSDQLKSIKQEISLSEAEKLASFYALKKRIDASRPRKDSVYARMLRQIADLQLKVNKDYTSAIQLINEALQISKSGKADASKKDAVNAALNLGYNYEELGIISEALTYYDTTLQLSRGIKELSNIFLFAKMQRTYLFLITGDYQRCIEESREGLKFTLQNKDSSDYFFFLNQKALSHFYLNQLTESLTDVQIILKFASSSAYSSRVSLALKTKALISEQNKELSKADALFRKSVAMTMRTNNFAQIADDYTDWGNFYLNTMHDIGRAKNCYLKVLKYAQLGDYPLGISKSFINLSEAAFDDKDFSKAIYYTVMAMQYFKLKACDNILLNPTTKQLNVISDKDAVIVLMSNKTALLIKLYKKTNDLKFLKSSVETALVTDTIITQMRHEQLGEQSKLYWRNYTRKFFTDAMEACYMANDVAHAFYFMERSRAVLLNDKLNELGASSHLSDADAKAEQNFKTRLASEQQKLSRLALNSAAFNDQEIALYRIKDDFEHFTRSLEKKYPSYYQYKYEDNLPSLESFQKYITKKNECFIHYFTSDTVAYILSIASNHVKITKLSKNEFDYQEINRFLAFCSNKDVLNKSFHSFATLSNTLYRTLFQPLQIPKGRVVICSDNFILPFEALCSDPAGKNFIVNDYVFSYAYSATYLLKDTKPSRAKGNFIGFAPVSFRAEPNMADLINSAEALTKSSEHYERTLLFTNKAATKKNFIRNIGGYTVVNIFSHASGSSSDSEPRLYMQDSLIYLSDLQFLNHPATRLVVLSACQTNVGKNAKGEGIYSLARGFASAGIPAIAATLWSADEDMIYEISTKFHEYLSEGFSKDVALHKAKLDFLNKNTSAEKKMPYYWANIILIGNTEPLELATDSTRGWWIAAISIIIISILILVVRLRYIVRSQI